MLIVSNFHDYYDTVSAFGIDKTVVFQRKTVDIKDPKLPSSDVPSPYPEEIRQKSARITKSVIGFCGQFFPLIQVALGEDVHTFFNSHDCIDFLKRTGIGLDERKSSRYYYSLFHRQDFSVRNAKNIENLFDPKHFAGLTPLFHQYKAPIFLYGYRAESDRRERRYLTLNPPLQPFKFARVKDPVSAFQDIYMFISGVLGTPERPTVEVSDKDKQAAKGHDGEYSFKKPPGGGRWR